MSAYDVLAARHRRFVDEYLVDGNGARAAEAAGYGEPGARQRACELLARVDVKAALAEKQAAASADAAERGRDARARLEEIAFMDLGDINDARASLLNVIRAACVDLLKLDSQRKGAEHGGTLHVIRAPEIIEDVDEWLRRYTQKTPT